VTAAQDENGSTPVLDADADRADLSVDVAALRGDDGLPPGGSAVLYVWTAAGSATTVPLVVPGDLSGRESIPLA
jgi:hypothetical protein